MIEGESTKQLRAQLPPEKLAQKHRSTMLGISLVLIGATMILGSYTLTSATLAAGKDFNKWLLAFMGGGMILVILGAYNVSGEVTRAFMKDARAYIPFFKKNGDNG